MNSDLTEAQKELFEWIKNYIKEFQHSPSIRQMMKAMELKSPAPIQSRLKHLQEKGYISWQEGRARTLQLANQLIGNNIPVLGSVAAGGLNESYSDINENLDMSEITQKNGVFALTVNGDSMIDAFIADGDMVLMEPVKEPSYLKNGTIVSALVPGSGTTLKYFFRKNNQIILEPANPNYDPIVLDLNDDASLDEFFTVLKDKDIYPDILVNNAGFTRDNIFLRMKDDEWSDVLNVHLNAQFKIIKNLIKPMLKNKYGRIINLSSAAAAIGNKGQANYVAAKSGVEAMSRTLAREFGQKNITINCVAPGFIETDMTDSLDEEYKRGIASQIPLQRFGKADEVAELIKFLTSSEADYITGQTIHINGGLFM